MGNPQMGQMPPMGQAPNQRRLNLLAAIPVIRDLLSGGDPHMKYMEMYQKYPEFREVADSVSGMTPEQGFQSRGYDFGQTMGVLSQHIDNLPKW
jgi:hypothetical protein